MKIENVNLEITDACNLRCTMCDIWKEKKNNYFTAGMINDIFSSDVLSEAVDVTLTGGEVFLHPELFSLVERIQHFRPKGIRTLSTNGFEFLYGRNEFRYCLTPFNRAFIMSTGDVFSCIHFAKIGNIKTASLEAMWYSSTAKGHQNRMEKGGCRKCVSYHGAGK